MKSLAAALLFLTSLFLFGTLFGQSGDIHALENLNLNKFSGKWYEIARLPTPFEEGLSRIVATYTLQKDGTIEVLNEGMKNGKPTSVKGRAWAPDPAVPARMLISFFLWFASDYIVLDMDPEGKSHLVVMGRTKNSYWLFSRTPKMETSLLDKKIKEAESLGFDRSKLIFVDQN